MATMKLEKLDLLVQECNELQICQAVLEELYYSCCGIQVAIEYLLSRYNLVGLNIETLEAKVKKLKEGLEGQMVLVTLYNRNAQAGSERLQKLMKVHFPETVEEINSLGDILNSCVKNLRQVILQSVTSCMGIHEAGRMVLDFLVNKRKEMV